ncbi:substrate-binding domain-containing protein [Neobacillus pocheonensis]|uniref:Substrate-binding domain-containing protein n=1 Tax=Neobacillus pocheonensis TaxID=363869 RepID=A0ABT0W6P1_9BACI|nr:substrate-binding domain-containing protein [Neobacillus pocheonensis]
MKKLITINILLFSIFFFFLYEAHNKWYSPNSMGQSNGGLQGEVNEKYVMITFQSGIDYWKNAIKGFEDAANELNVSVEYRGATQHDVHEQITVLEKIIAQKPAGIALSAINANELKDSINKAIDAGIPVVLFDSDSPTSKTHSFLGTNNYNAGVEAAEKLAHLIGGKGKVAIVTILNQLNHQERTKGFQETMEKEYPGIKIVAIKDGKGDQVVSRKVTADIIDQNQDLNGIFMTEGDEGLGGSEAIQNKNVKIISFDTDKETLDLIKAGKISATIAQDTWNMGYWSLNFLFHLKHKLTPSPGNPPYVDTGISIVTKDNVENFYAK